ncbi:MAG TPA: glycosyltransferase family 4 protein [Elusimicrobiota bacterium]|nr:glycosyltransferase family 4 protein [Elusimicrobiota bacterium]
MEKQPPPERPTVLVGDLHYATLRSTLPGLAAQVLKQRPCLILSPRDTVAHDIVAPVPVHYVGLPKKHPWPVVAVSLAVGLWRFFRRHRPALVHLHACALHYYWVWAGVMRILRIPYGVTFHSYVGSHEAGSPAERFRRYLKFREWEFFLLPKALFVSTVSTALLRHLHDRFKKRWDIRVIPNGFDFPSENPPSPTPPLPPTPYLCSLCGGLPGKGADWLLFAFQTVLQTEPNVHLLLCGSGTARLKSLIGLLRLDHRVHLMDFVPRAQVPYLLRNSLFYVHPTRQETFGLAVLEALGEGKAVVAPEIGGLVDYLKNDENAHLVPVLDVAALADGMIRLLKDPAYRSRLEKGARQTADRFTWSQVAPRYLQIYPS